MTTKEPGRVPIFIRINEGGELCEIGTVSRTADGQLHPYDLAEFFRACADEIEQCYVRAIKDLVVKQTTDDQRRKEDARCDGTSG